MSTLCEALGYKTIYFLLSQKCLSLMRHTDIDSSIHLMPIMNKEYCRFGDMSVNKAKPLLSWKLHPTLIK